MKLFGFFHLRSIGGQIAALVVASIIALHLILTLIFLVSRPDRAEPPPDSAHHLADAAQLLGSASASERPRLMSDIARAFPALGIEQLAPGAAEAIKDTEGQHLHGMRRHLGRGYKVMALSPDGGEHRVGVELPDGTMIAGRVEREPQNRGGRGSRSTRPAIMVPSGNSTPTRCSPPSGDSAITL